MHLTQAIVKFGPAAPRQLAGSQIRLTDPMLLKAIVEIFPVAIEGKASTLRHDWEPFYVLEIGLGGGPPRVVQVRGDFTYYAFDGDWRLNGIRSRSVAVQCCGNWVGSFGRHSRDILHLLPGGGRPIT
jgi:hypothetical protein